jgi:tetratricopeptide (TPR) repeat protein
MGQFDNAIADFSKGIELFPNGGFLYFNRGLAYAQKGDTDNALANLNKAIELNPEETSVYLYRGILYTQMNQKENAIADFQKVLASTQDEEIRAQATEWLKSLGVNP